MCQKCVKIAEDSVSYKKTDRRILKFNFTLNIPIHLSKIEKTDNNKGGGSKTHLLSKYTGM